MGVAVGSGCGALGCLGLPEWLHLSHNQLACLPLDVFTTPDSLLLLALSHNLFIILDPCSLWGLGNLSSSS